VGLPADLKRVAVSLDVLKLLRWVVPGVILAVMLEPLLRITELAAKYHWPDILGYPATVVVFGVVYDVLELRRLAFERPLSTINRNIEESLLAFCASLPEVVAASSYLQQERRLMNVFYAIVDNDKSLTEKAKRVRANGLIWSSLADLQVLGAIGGVVYLAGAAISRSGVYALTSLGLIALVALTRLSLMPMTTKKHLRLSNEQLEMIQQQHREDVCDRLSALVNASP
jgi:hypothetical protein